MDNGIYYINDRYHDLFLQLNVFSDMIHLVTLDKENHIRPAMHIYLDRSVPVTIGLYPTRLDYMSSMTGTAYHWGVHEFPGFLMGSVLLLLMVLVFCVVFCFFFVLCLVCPLLPVPLECSFLIAPSVFSNICLY